jgi:DNA polymerase-3 subunit delta'
MFPWHEQVWTLWSALRRQLPHALLVQGMEGQGEFEFGRAASQSLLCEKPLSDGRACGSCPACSWFVQGNHPDFRLLLPESLAEESRSEEQESGRKEKRSEQIRIEQVRELSSFLAVGTHRGGVRVVLIYPAETMNSNTQNALLKNLEEPPPLTVFLLVSSHPERLLPTVRSRSQKFLLPLPDKAKATDWLRGQGVAQPEAALAQAGGAPLIVLRQIETQADRTRFLEALCLPGFDPIGLADTAQRVPVWEVVDWLQRWSYDLQLARVSGGVHYYPGYRTALLHLSRQTQPAGIAAYLRRLAEARALARHPLNAKLFIEDLLLHYRETFFSETRSD